MENPIPKNRSQLLQYFLLASYAIALFLLLYRIQSVWAAVKWFLGVLSPLFTGVVLAFIFHLPFNFFKYKVFSNWEHHRSMFLRKAWRGVSLLLAYGSVFFCIGILLALVLPRIGESIGMLANNFGSYLKGFQNWADGLLCSLSIHPDISGSVSEIWAQLISLLQRLLGQIVNGAFDFTVGFTTGFANFMFALVLSIFMLYNCHTLCPQLKRLSTATIGSRATGSIEKVLQRVNTVFSSFILGQLTEAIILGVLCFTGMTILGLEYALLISTIISVTALVPVLGAWVGTLPSLVILLVIEPIQALWFLLYILLLQQLENNFIYPRVVGNAIGLPGMFVLASILIGGGLFGLWGMLLGTPTAAVCYQLIREWLHKREKSIRKQRI